MMLEKTNPVMKLTLSSFTYFSAIWRPTSGLNWSSPTSTSAGRPPSLPPFSLIASWNASRMSTPRAPAGPESVLTNPTFTLLAPWAPAATHSAAARAIVLVFMSRPLKGIEIFKHFPAGRRIGQRTRAGGQIVAHVLGLGRAGNGAGDGRMADDPFEEVLRPAADAKVGCPGRQGLAAGLPEQGALGKGAIDDHRGALFGGQGKNSLLRFALGERIVDLQEIVAPLLQPGFHLAIGRRSVVRDPHVAHPALLLPVLQRSGVGRHVDEVVHLQEIHALHPQPL